MILDLEGTDGRERGEDDTAFERQSALFALAISDIVMVNIWCHDIGREHGAGKPLMKTVFQVCCNCFILSTQFVIEAKKITQTYADINISLLLYVESNKMAALVNQISLNGNCFFQP